jgi:glyoxylase-like metal-dependent hydrolase (beta-lactamase superfamily II)
VTSDAQCVLAPNASPWTLDGTNTWLLTAPGCDAGIVVDPGPRDADHLAAVREAAERRGVRIATVLLTHGHIDHSEGARALAEQLGVGVRALDPLLRFGDEGLAAGDVVAVGDLEVRVVETPGHSSDSVSFLHGDAILTGDTVLGRGTSFVGWPEGRLSDYLDSLARLRDVAASASALRLLPGHGPVLANPVGVLDAYLAHRRARLVEVEEVVASGVSDPSEIVALIYADVSRAVWPAAELTVRAQLEYLSSR